MKALVNFAVGLLLLIQSIYFSDHNPKNNPTIVYSMIHRTITIVQRSIAVVSTVTVAHHTVTPGQSSFLVSSWPG